MNFNQLINQVLGAAKQYGDKAAQSDTLTKLGGGAAAAGLLSMFLKKGKGQRIAHAGSMAALGALAYAAYQKYQQNQSAGNAAQQAEAAAPLALPETAFAANNDSENAGRVILRTMIAAAAADGSIDEAEQSLILQEGGEDVETRQKPHVPHSLPRLPAKSAAIRLWRRRLIWPRVWCAPICRARKSCFCRSCRRRCSWTTSWWTVWKNRPVFKRLEKAACTPFSKVQAAF